MTNKKTKVSIIGVTGYTGTELLRILLQHPGVEIAYLVSRQHEDTPLGALFPRLRHVEGLTVTNTDYETVAAESDVVFLCLPHVASQEVAPVFLGKTKLIDMSADFRIGDAQTYEKYYHTAHQRPDLLDGRFVYGLPEIFRADIAKADAVANPGCFALLVQLLLLPFKDMMTQADVIAVSGTSGGGRKARDPVEHPYCSQNIRSYLVNEHRHTPEILATTGLAEKQFNFAPTVGPFMRGIFAHGFVHLEKSLSQSDLDKLAVKTLGGNAFVRLSDEVNMTHVLSTNFCDYHFRPGHGNTVIAQGALDNLLKGAAGTAVQNMNLMCGLDESDGLHFDSPIYP